MGDHLRDAGGAEWSDRVIMSTSSLVAMLLCAPTLAGLWLLFSDRRGDDGSDAIAASFKTILDTADRLRIENAELHARVADLQRANVELRQKLAALEPVAETYDYRTTKEDVQWPRGNT